MAIVSILGFLANDKFSYLIFEYAEYYTYTTFIFLKVSAATLVPP
jgi:hypothetical protein